MNTGIYKATIQFVNYKLNSNSEQIVIVMDVVEDEEGKEVPTERLYKTFTLKYDGEWKSGSKRHLWSEMIKLQVKLPSGDASVAALAQSIRNQILGETVVISIVPDFNDTTKNVVLFHFADDKETEAVVESEHQDLASASIASADIIHEIDMTVSRLTQLKLALMK